MKLGSAGSSDRSRGPGAEVGQGPQRDEAESGGDEGREGGSEEAEEVARPCWGCC